MFCTRRVALLVGIGLLVSTSSALAGGGGGTKRNGTIRVVNNSTGVVGVTTNGNSSAITTAFNDKSTTEFTAAGGRLVNPGSSTSFSVLAGTYTIAAADSAFDTPITETVAVSKGQTVTVTINSDTASTSTIQFGTTVSGG